MSELVNVFRTNSVALGQLGDILNARIFSASATTHEKQTRLVIIYYYYLLLFIIINIIIIYYYLFLFKAILQMTC